MTDELTTKEKKLLRRADLIELMVAPLQIGAFLALMAALLAPVFQVLAWLQSADFPQFNLSMIIAPPQTEWLGLNKILELIWKVHASFVLLSVGIAFAFAAASAFPDPEPEELRNAKRKRRALQPGTID